MVNVGKPKIEDIGMKPFKVNRKIIYKKSEEDKALELIEKAKILAAQALIVIVLSFEITGEFGSPPPPPRG